MEVLTKKNYLKNEAKDEEIQLEGGSDEKKLLGGDKR